MFEYSFTVREVHPFMSSLVNRAIVGVCVCSGSQEGCRAVGGPWLAG